MIWGCGCGVTGNHNGIAGTGGCGVMLACEQSCGGFANNVQKFRGGLSKTDDLVLRAHSCAHNGCCRRHWRKSCRSGCAVFSGLAGCRRLGLSECADIPGRALERPTAAVRSAAGGTGLSGRGCLGRLGGHTRNDVRSVSLLLPPVLG
jgi:hypothetical protein